MDELDFKHSFDNREFASLTRYRARGQISERGTGE